MPDTKVMPAATVTAFGMRATTAMPGRDTTIAPATSPEPSAVTTAPWAVRTTTTAASMTASPTVTTTRTTIGAIVWQRPWDVRPDTTMTTTIGLRAIRRLRTYRPQVRNRTSRTRTDIAMECM